MRRWITFLILFGILSYANAQQQINGRIVDAETMKPIDGARIVILGTNIGTVSNFLGYFQFTLDSIVGFQITATGYDAVETSPIESNAIQISLKKSVVEEIFYPVDVQPEFKGGFAAFYEYIQKNIKWPKKSGTVNGKVFIQFVIDKDGSIIQDSVKVHQGYLPWCDDEAVRLIKESPQWKPGMSQGRPAKVRFILPITFRNE